MSCSIQYRSTETMHPAQAYAIKEHAARLIDGYTWLSCEPVTLQQLSDGFLIGFSKPNFFPPEVEPDAEYLDGVPDGTVLTLAEVLCELSREHGVSWDIGHDFEPRSIGRISNGAADSELIEQLETFGSVGDLLDDMLDEGDPEWETVDFGLVSDLPSDDKPDDDEPKLLKFPQE